jgi:hypothetical protein
VLTSNSNAIYLEKENKKNSNYFVVFRYNLHIICYLRFFFKRTILVLTISQASSHFIEKFSSWRHERCLLGKNINRFLYLYWLEPIFTNPFQLNVDVFYYLLFLDKLHYYWLSTIKCYFTITLLSHLPLPISQTRSHIN